MPAKDMKPNLWQQQRFGQNVASPEASKKTFIEEELDVDAPKQTRLSGNGNSKIKSEEKVDVYASLRTIRSEAIQSLLAKMRVEHERLCAAAAVGSASTTLSNNHGGSAVLPTSLAAWDVHDDEPQQVTTEKMPDWTHCLTDKETDKHLTNVELILRILNEVKDRARKASVSYMAASPFPRWILGALYEMRLTVAFYDAQGEGMLSSLQKHPLSLAKLATSELEEMKREVERESELGANVWGTIAGRDDNPRAPQDAHMSKDQIPPHGPTKSTSAQAQALIVEEEHDYAKIKREDQIAAKDRIDRSSKVGGQAKRSPNVKQEGASSGWPKTLNGGKKGVKPKTLFIGEVHGVIYHFVDTGGEVSCTCGARQPQHPANIQQYKLTQLMNTLLSHENAAVRDMAKGMFPFGITAEVDEDGNYVDDWV